jgi:hypothetical protein
LGGLDQVRATRALRFGLDEITVNNVVLPSGEPQQPDIGRSTNKEAEDNNL